jgi:hypothetical protein
MLSLIMGCHLPRSQALHDAVQHSSVPFLVVLENLQEYGKDPDEKGLLDLES